LGLGFGVAPSGACDARPLLSLLIILPHLSPDHATTCTSSSSSSITNTFHEGYPFPGSRLSYGRLLGLSSRRPTRSLPLFSIPLLLPSPVPSPQKALGFTCTVRARESPGRTGKSSPIPSPHITLCRRRHRPRLAGASEGQTCPRQPPSLRLFLVPTIPHLRASVKDVDAHAMTPW